MPIFDHDGLKFHYRSEGRGVPVVWQHGLGSDIDQTFALLEPGFNQDLAGFHFLGFDARGHGLTQPLGDPAKLAIATSADDLLALLDALQIERAIIGGISMGAAISLNFALRFPERVLGLVLSRPAWLDRPFPANLHVFPLIARALRDLGPAAGLVAFRQTLEYAALVHDSPDTAQIVTNGFENPRALECVARLERIPHDAPCDDRQLWRTLSVPALVLANHQDPIHPWEFADTFATLIPGATLREITSKSVSLDRHAADLRRHLGEFLLNHFAATSNDRQASA